MMMSKSTAVVEKFYTYKALLSPIPLIFYYDIISSLMAKTSRSLRKEIETLGRVSSTIVSEMYLEDILKIIVAMTAEVMGSKICSLMLLNSKGDELGLVATQSLSKEYLGKPNVKIGQSISGKAVSTKKPITVLNVKKDPNYMFPEIAKKEKLCSMLAVPLIIKGKVVGVLNSYTSKPHKFTLREIKLVSAVANQVAIAIHNRKLAEEKEKLEAKLEERKIVERAKGILMKKEGISEADAYRKLQKRSMDNRKSMKEIAEAVILSR
jgi:signal transduction protein with GAF and PtsI domain